MAEKKQYNLDNVLITGARSPVALEWARILYSCDKTVFLADSLKYPIAAFTKSKDGYFQVPSPRFEFKKYKDCILKIIQIKKITTIIPTCEEAFYLAFMKSEVEQYCDVFVSDFELMKNLHNKFQFNQLRINSKIKSPYSELICDISELKTSQSRFTEFILKPIYSRFASKIRVNQKYSDLIINRNNPWVIQQFIHGLEFCSYSLLANGKLLGYSIYQPKYRVGNGSGIYFYPHEYQMIKDFLIEFGKHTSYTGQVGFDFIFDGKDFFVLECNPRGTSGIHLISESPQAIIDSLEGKQGSQIKASQHPKMVKLAMLVFGFKYIFKSIRPFLRDFCRARDVIGTKDDKSLNLKQFISMFEILLLALTNKISILDASTTDIEYDGELDDKF